MLTSFLTLTRVFLFALLPVAPAKNGWWTDHSKSDASVEEDIFLAEHIFLGNTSCTNLCRFLQIESAYCKTQMEKILQKYSSCTFTLGGPAHSDWELSHESRKFSSIREGPGKQCTLLYTGQTAIFGHPPFWQLAHFNWAVGSNCL